MAFKFEEEYVNIPKGVASFMDIEHILTLNTIIGNKTIIEDQTQQNQAAQIEIQGISTATVDSVRPHNEMHNDLQPLESVVVGQIVSNNAGNSQ